MSSKKKTAIIITIVLASVCLILQIFVWFYSFAYQKAILAIRFANQELIIESEEEGSWVSNSDLLRLKIVDDHYIQSPHEEQLLILYMSKTKIQKIGLTSISFRLIYKYDVLIGDSFHKINELNGEAIIHLNFKNWQWYVTAVEGIIDGA